MEIVIIAAMAQNRVIGDHGVLPWKIPEDLRLFRALTMGSPVIMGRRTWDSIGGPLEGRVNIVLSRNPSFEAEGAIVAHSIETALGRAANQNPRRVFIIGGGEVFRETISLADRLIVSELGLIAHGDTRFPEIDLRAWREVSRAHQSSVSGVAFDVVERERVRRRGRDTGG